jgi:hypothetical protein
MLRLLGLDPEYKRLMGSRDARRRTSEMGLDRNSLRRHVRLRKRLKRAARNIDTDAAADAYVAFAGLDDDDMAVELAVGRLLLLLDQRHLIEER